MKFDVGDTVYLKTDTKKRVKMTVVQVYSREACESVFNGVQHYKCSWIDIENGVSNIKTNTFPSKALK